MSNLMTNKNGDCYAYGISPYSWVQPHSYYKSNFAISLGSNAYITTIESPTVINLTAAGLRHSDIEVKEVDGKLTVKTKTGLTGHYTNLNNSYQLKNVKLNSLTLKLGVLTLEFVDTENVVRHNVKEINDL